AQQLGTESARRRAIERAIAELGRAERFDPNPSTALYEDRARYHAALGAAAEAAQDRRRAREILPTSARDHYLLGTTLLASNQPDRAEVHLSRAVALDPKRFWAWFALGLCHKAQGRFAEAAGDFGTCTALYPEFAWPHLNRGLALADAGRLVEARAAF